VHHDSPASAAAIAARTQSAGTIRRASIAAAGVGHTLRLMLEPLVDGQ
jgi:hypothetical protein